MKKMKNPSAFTLIEMIIAITVFTIFMSFSMATYIAFHRAQQEAAISRNLLFESESILSMLTESLKENQIDYELYDVDQSLDPLRTQDLGLQLTLASPDGISGHSLSLLSPDRKEKILFSWNEQEESFTVQHFDEEGNPMDGYLQPIRLHSELTRAKHVSFHIFPSKNPYDPVNSDQDELQYQPIVKIELVFARPGRVNEEVVLDLETSVTSQIYR